MSKELVTKQGSDLAVYTETKSMGAADEITSSDIQVPSIMLMQAMSTFVQDRSNDIKSGDFVHSVTMETLGHAEGGDIDLVVVDMFKTEIISEAEGKKNWISTKPWTAEHESMPYEDHIDGLAVIRQKCFNYVCFRPLETREVMTPNGLQYIASPIVVKFKGASAKHGKKFNQMLQDMATFGQPSWATSFLLTGKEESNDKGTYFVFEMKYGEQTIKEVQLAAANLSFMSQEARNAGQMDVIDIDEDVAKEKTVRNHADDLY